MPLTKYKIIWAFDTKTTDDCFDDNFPVFSDEDGESKLYSLSNKTEQVFKFLSMDNPIAAKFSRYLTKLLNIDIDQTKYQIESGNGDLIDLNKRYYYIAYYAYFINFIRLKEASPVVELFNKQDGDIDVDLVVDIGNSRTCGVLFEQDFTKSQVLELIDLSCPDKRYKDSIDMRIVFRNADFGKDLALGIDAFEWKSFVRIGEEAKRLIYNSKETDGRSQLTTNYSSPKRYLWDDRLFDGEWYPLITTSDPTNIKVNDKIHISGLSEFFDEKGVYNGISTNLLTEKCKYSRQSLMTFVFVELLQHAILQINSIKYRQHIGNIDCRRKLRNIIITCPTAMPISEQKTLRMSAKCAYNVLQNCNPTLNNVNIIPHPNNIGKTAENKEDAGIVAWSYDEASCCQLVYLYSEIVEKYGGEVERLFRELSISNNVDSVDNKSVTIGTIDIGAGTTDVIINKYNYNLNKVNTLEPIPLYWDSFYVAGDDILQKLVQFFVIDGEISEYHNYGSIYSAVTKKIMSLSNDELRTHTSITTSSKPEIYTGLIDNICKCNDDITRNNALENYASILVNDFFGKNRTIQSDRQRKLRAEFNIQISVPIAQKMMDLLRNRSPYKAYTFDEIFDKFRPTDYLLSYFEGHFGFCFTELLWNFDPIKVSSLIQSVMEPLLKQISIIIDAYSCDVLILAGRPTSLDAISSLFLKFFPLSPDKLICLNNDGIGSWYPFENDPCGQKAVVAVGALIAHLSSTNGFEGMRLDLNEMKWSMKSTANYIGEYKDGRIYKSILTPDISDSYIEVSTLPYFIGCKQFDAQLYQARPLYIIDKVGESINKYKYPLKIKLVRDWEKSKEIIKIESIVDANNEDVNKKYIEIKPQSIVDDGLSWLDKGAFEITIK